jgi:lipoprotein-anchoring transpeptidase ErfK/SrfK
MKFNSGIAMLGLFGAAVIGGGFVLLSQSDDMARALPPQSASGEFGKVGTAAPKSIPAPVAAATLADERFVIKRILPINGPIKYGKWHWDDANVPDGPIVITVDLDARVLSVFKGGYEIGATAVLLGTSEKPTPLGSFPIKWKKADHYSSIYDQAPMPFTQNLTDDGVAIHGTKVEKGYASHGCIGVPDDFGRKLFGVTKLGDKVIITKGKTAKQGDSLI